LLAELGARGFEDVTMTADPRIVGRERLGQVRLRVEGAVERELDEAELRLCVG
jgi:hypothetical protein